ncbi:MAG: YjfB family protein [Spirochaetaceae bacterium]|jgi:hypothetical protein|nr:YjfB family protein [Spirochaetaceae bacterium]
MDIQQLSTGFYLQQTREQAAVQVQSMILDTAREQGAALTDMLESVGIITEPYLGNVVDILA